MNDVQKEQVKEFLKHIAAASAKLEKAKTGISVEKTPMKFEKRKKLSKAIKELESKIADIADEESKLVAAQERGAELVEALSSQVLALTNKLDEIGRHDIDAIEGLKAEVKVLEDDLKKARRIGRLEGIEDLSSMISDLKKKMEEMIAVETAHQKRVQELESKIDKTVSNNYVEIIKIEEMLKNMEEKYELMRKKGKYDETMLDFVKEKIAVLKEKLHFKKERFATALAKPVSRELASKAEVPEIPKPPEVPRLLKPLIRHEMHITPVPPKPSNFSTELKSLEKKLKATKPLEEKPKKGFLSRILFGHK